MKMAQNDGEASSMTLDETVEVDLNMLILATFLRELMTLMLIYQ
jgi:hypothetical protein